jgi:thiol-disulfide isomerase/thioredoxin
LVKRIQKNINLLTLEGHPAPPLARAESIGTVAVPSLADLKGKVVVLFFWAHWCPDCKIEGPILAKLLQKYGSQGLAIVAPTQRYGYVAGGAKASPEDEMKYIAQVRDQYYPWLAGVPVPVSAADHERYGVSSTPTMVIVDRAGIIRDYHPGRMSEEELEREIGALLVGGGNGGDGAGGNGAGGDGGYGGNGESLNQRNGGTEQRRFYFSKGVTDFVWGHRVRSRYVSTSF